MGNDHGVIKCPHSLPYTTFTPVILPRIGAAVEEDLVTGTGVMGPGNRNNIQLASISVVTMHGK